MTLERFLKAQSPIYGKVCEELAAGQKTNHWMWFIFPQLRGLGKSDMATFYGLADRREALAYWQDPLLGRRLVTCTQLVLALKNRTVLQIFGSPDDLKLRSCATLFEAVATPSMLFSDLLSRRFGDTRDSRTLAMLEDDDGS